MSRASVSCVRRLTDEEEDHVATACGHAGKDKTVRVYDENTKDLVSGAGARTKAMPVSLDRGLETDSRAAREGGFAAPLKR